MLVSVDDQKEVSNTTRDKMNTQEPPYTIPITTSGQPQEQKSEDTLVKVDTTVKVIMIEQHTKTVEEITKEQIG